MSAPILVAGAGTTGLTMACELSRHGAPVRIVDKLASINPHCRATGLHARTLDIFYDLGIVEEILAQGNKVLGMSQYANGERFMHYLIRPDGYVGYRSEPATARALHDYLARIFLLE